MIKNTKIYVTDNKGIEQELDLLFTAENKGINYVVYVLEDDETVVPYRYDENKNLTQLEDEEEWDFIEKTFEEYMSKNMNEDNSI